MSLSGNHSGFSYGADIEGLCERVTYILGDADKGYPNQTWEKDFIQALVCDSLFMLAHVKPNVFKADTVRVQLKPETSKQTVDCDECELLLEFVCIELEDGTVIPTVESDYKKVERASLLPAFCYNCRGGVMSRVASAQVALSKKSLDTFVINPMFPAGEEVFAVVRCRNLKKYYSGEEELPQGVRGHFPAIIQMTLYLALAGDRVAGGHAELANQHFSNFTQLMGLTMQQAEFLRRQMEKDK